MQRADAMAEVRGSLSRPKAHSPHPRVWEHRGGGEGEPVAWGVWVGGWGGAEQERRVWELSAMFQGWGWGWGLGGDTTGTRQGLHAT